MTALIQSKIAIKPSKLHGYGVFAKKRIRKGTIIEECYCLVASNVGLNNYMFSIDDDSKLAYLALGCGSIYNHADDPNADYEFNQSTNIMKVLAVKNIKRGEEILISYGDNYFKSRGSAPLLSAPTMSKVMNLWYRYRRIIKVSLVMFVLIMLSKGLLI